MIDQKLTSSVHSLEFLQKRALVEACSPTLYGKSDYTDHFLTTRILLGQTQCDLGEIYGDVASMSALVHVCSKQQDGGRFYKNPPKSLLDWISFLRTNAFDADTGETATSALYYYLFSHLQSGNAKDPHQLSEEVDAIFLLCLLRADVTQPRALGAQALHYVMMNKWSLALSPYVTELAYVLVRYGHADVYAREDNGFSVSDFAVFRGWYEEWFAVLIQCGFDLDDLLQEHLEYCDKVRRSGGGESSAVDTEDLTSLSEQVGLLTSGAVRRRKLNVGAGSDEE